LAGYKLNLYSLLIKNTNQNIEEQLTNC